MYHNKIIFFKKLNPVFTEIEKSYFSEDSSQQNQNFFFRVDVSQDDQQITGFGAGTTKKMAKHEAAENLLLNIKKHLLTGDIDVDFGSSSGGTSSGDSISELLNFCVLKNYHKPLYCEIENYGPTHSPTFTYECRLDSIRRSGTSSSKGQAKQLAAKNVLEIVKKVCKML